MAWRDFWPFGRRAKPKAPPQPIDCRANGNWVPGDLAVCTVSGFSGPPDAPDPVKGHIYRVIGVLDTVMDQRAYSAGCLIKAYWLRLEELPGYLYQSNTFRKVVPDHSPCEEEFAEFLLGGPTLPELTPETAA